MATHENMPTPLTEGTLKQNDGSVAILGANGERVARVDAGPGSPQAAFFVRAINAHENNEQKITALVEALEELEQFARRYALRKDEEPGNQTLVSLVLGMADRARAALALAKEER